jgi:hypothetical protein
VSGGLACIAGALLLARLLPAFSRQQTPVIADPADQQPLICPGTSVGDGDVRTV